MVMFLFVIAYLGGRADAPWAGGTSWQRVAAIVAASALLVEVVAASGLAADGRLSDEAADRGGLRRPARDRPSSS